MLSLRKGLLVRKRSSASSISTGHTEDQADGPACSVMETIRAGLQESAHGLSSKSLRKGSDAPSISVRSISSSGSDKTTVMADDAVSVSTTNTSNSQAVTTATMTSATSIQITRVSEVSRLIRTDICNLGEYT